MKKIINKLYKFYKRTLNPYHRFFGRFGRNPQEFYLVSYPKSGNTWFRIVIANLLNENSEEAFLKDVGAYVPDYHVLTQLSEAGKKGSLFRTLPIRFVKSHAPYSDFFKGKNVVLIVRDGRDVMVSYKEYLNGRNTEKLELDDLINSDEHLYFGSWGDHVLSWHKHQAAKVIWVKYEDLLAHPKAEFQRVFKEMDWDISDDYLSKAIDASSFKSLRAKEEKHGVNFKERVVDQNSKFFRKGESGDWVNHFSENQIKTFEERFGKAMKLLKYH